MDFFELYRKSPLFLHRNISRKLNDQKRYNSNQNYQKLIQTNKLQFIYIEKRTQILSDYNEFTCFLCVQNRKMCKNPFQALSQKSLLTHVLLSHPNISILASIQDKTLILKCQFNPKFYKKPKSEIKMYCDYSMRSQENWEFFTNRREINDLRTQLFMKIFQNIFPTYPKEQKKLKFAEDDMKFVYDEEYKELSKEEIKQKLKSRQFFHSQNIFEEIVSDSLFEESELDIDDSTIKESEERTIDDFEDVNESDKLLFKMWNYFIREKRKQQHKDNQKSGNIIYYKKMNYHDYLMCFLVENKYEIAKIRQSFVMFLATFEIYDKIQSTDILSLLLKLDEK